MHFIAPLRGEWGVENANPWPRRPRLGDHVTKYDENTKEMC